MITQNLLQLLKTPTYPKIYYNQYVIFLVLNHAKVFSFTNYKDNGNIERFKRLKSSTK